MRPLGDRLPDVDWGLERRRAVCRRCHLIMVDAEPAMIQGQFYHLASPHQTRARRCPNAGKRFSTDNLEIEPFLRKARRRFLKRASIRP